MKRSTKVVIGSSVAVAAAAVCCGLWPSEDEQRVCTVTDNGVEVAVPEAQCPDGDGNGGSGGAHWYYIPSSSSRPGVGSKVSGGSTTRGGFGGLRGFTSGG